MYLNGTTTAGSSKTGGDCVYRGMDEAHEAGPTHAAPSRDTARGTLLSPAQRLALQLHARGYSAAQIARLVDQPAAGVATVLALASSRLGAADVPGGVRAARRRGLIT